MIDDATFEHEGTVLEGTVLEGTVLEGTVVEYTVVEYTIIDAGPRTRLAATAGP